MTELSVEFLGKWISRLDDENTVGIALVGSFARREGGAYSDVDLWHFVRQIPSAEVETSRLEWIDGHLVSLKTLLLEQEQRDFSIPEKAIWAIPGWQQCRILLDKDGSLGRLQQAALGFRWESLQKAADAFVSHHLAGSAEEIYKILDGLSTKNECKTLYAIWSLSRDMADVLLVQHGMLIPTENAFIDCAQAVAGRDSEWTRQFRLAIGLDQPPANQASFICFGTAGLRLYRETVALMRDILQPKDVPLVERALGVMREAGYL